MVSRCVSCARPFRRTSGVDPLSDALRAVRVTGAYFYLIEAAEPWAVAARASHELKARVMPEAGLLIPFHAVTSGNVFAAVDGAPPVRVDAGDVILLPHGHAHRLGSDAEHLPDPSMPGAEPARYAQTMRLGNGGRVTATIVCGFLGVEAGPFNPLLDSLPSLMHAPGAAGGWLSAFPLRAVAESTTSRAGSDSVLTRIAELMLVEVLRQHAQHVSGNGTTGASWVAALRDPVVGRVLACFHERPAHPWTLPLLVREVAASRTVIAERFTAAVGMPPKQYLTRWRLRLAADALARDSDKVAAIGTRYGYASEAAFSRAFKRAVGVSPSSFRESAMRGRATPVRGSRGR